MTFFFLVGRGGEKIRQTQDINRLATLKKTPFEIENVSLCSKPGSLIRWLSNEHIANACSSFGYMIIQSCELKFQY